jgi:hypothetical protein
MLKVAEVGTVQPLAVIIQVFVAAVPAVFFTSTLKSAIVEEPLTAKVVVQLEVALTDFSIKIQASTASFANALIPEDVRQALKLRLHLCRCAC